MELLSFISSVLLITSLLAHLGKLGEFKYYKKTFDALSSGELVCVEEFEGAYLFIPKRELDLLTTGLKRETDITFEDTVTIISSHKAVSLLNRKGAYLWKHPLAYFVPYQLHWHKKIWDWFCANQAAFDEAIANRKLQEKN